MGITLYQPENSIYVSNYRGNNIVKIQLSKKSDQGNLIADNLFVSFFPKQI